MEIKKVKDKKKWTDFTKKHKASFLQSWQWGSFKSKNQKVFRIGAFQNNSIVGICQFFEEKLPFGNYLYCPYGPIVSKKVSVEKFLREIKEYFKKETDFLRIEPVENISLGVKAFKRHQPKKTLIVDLKKEDDLLSDFDKDTRYSVRKAKREGVEVKEEVSVNSFYKILKEVSDRHIFRIYSKEYYQNLLNLEIVKLFEARHEEDVLASAFTIFFGDTATYLHAGSSKKKRSFCGSSLLNFEIMNFAFEKGFSKYDFWGIDKKKMPGVTKFKKGFGGREVSYPGAIDIPINLKYQVYEKIYKIKKRINL